MNFLEYADRTATLWINSIHCPASDWVWLVMSHKTIWIALYLVVLFFLFRNLGWKKALVVTLSAVAAVGFSNILADIFKDYFLRLRPCCDKEMIENGLRALQKVSGPQYGFFSAHAANSMAFAVSTALGFSLNDKSRNYRAYSLGIVIWSILVGISRIFVGKHFLGDVLVGFLFGTVIAYTLSLLALRINKKIK